MLPDNDFNRFYDVVYELEKFISTWRRQGVCQACIDFRIVLYKNFSDSDVDYSIYHDVRRCKCKVDDEI